MRLGRAIVWIIAGAIIIRLLALGITMQAIGPEALTRGDAVGYIELATNLGQGLGYVSTVDGTLASEVFRSAGFPLLYVPFTFIPNGIIIYGVLMSLLAGVLLPLLTFLSAQRITDHRAALVAAALMAFEPHAVTFSFSPLTEVPFMIFALGGLLLSLIAYERSSYAITACAGGLFGYAAFIRPGYFQILSLAFVLTALVLCIQRDIRYRHVLVTFACMLLVLTPWFVRNHSLTGVYALSGQGWRNVYTDYVASIRALDNGTTFHDEKEQLKIEAMDLLGISRRDIGSPANASALRSLALNEVWHRKMTVLKLEAALVTSFFIQDGYYYQFRNYGYVNDPPGGHISPTRELLTNGLGATPAIFKELVRQRFIPLWGRLFAVGILISTVAGFFMLRHRIKYAFVLVIALAAVTATVLGLGMDARLRIPAEPLFFILAATPLVRLFDIIRKRYAR